MATTTYNYTLSPASGWVQIAGPSGFLRVRSDPATRSFYLYIGDTMPTDTSSAIGLEISDEEYWSNVAYTGNAYARVTDGTVRLDVEAIPASGGGGGGGGGATTIADGADTAEGSRADTAYTGSGSSTVIALLKGLYNALLAPTPAGTNSIGSVNVSSSALPTGAATSANQPSRDSNNDLRVQTVTITETIVAVAANTSTQLVAANSARIGLEIQPDGTAAVGVGRKGQTLTSVASSNFIIPSGSYPLYTMPFSTKTTVTTYTGTAQNVRITEYVQQ